MNISCTTYSGTSASLIADLRKQGQQKPKDDFVALALAVALYQDRQFSESASIASTVFRSDGKEGQINGEQSLSVALTELKGAVNRAKVAIPSHYASNPDPVFDATIALQQLDLLLEILGSEDGS